MADGNARRSGPLTQRVPHEVLAELRRREILRDRNATGDIGEFLAAAIYNVERAVPGTGLFTVRGECSAVIHVHAAVLAALRNRIRVL
jgi:hypothetical protein